MKKTYTAPKLTELGDITELTHGQGWKGSSDSVWIFSFINISWGTSG
jgi:hypothetical protein